MKGKVFSEALFHAAIQGRKTQFRELVKPQPTRIRSSVFVKSGFEDNHGRELKPRFREGDTVFLREQYYMPVNIFGTEMPDRGIEYIYGDGDGLITGFIRKSAITMRSEYARYFIKILDVKCERLRDISEDDAIKEGVERLFTEEECKTVAGIIGTKPEQHGYKNYLWHGLIGKSITGKQSDNWEYQYSGYESAKDSFSSLFESLHGIGAWQANPYVFVYDFELVNKPFDQILEDNKDINN